MSTRRTFLRSALFFPAFTSVRAFAQDDRDAGSFNSQAIDTFVTAQMESMKIPAVSLGVFRSGRPMLLRAYGIADREKNIPATVDTPFRIASVSKQFFATAILILAQEGKLSLEDRASKYIPDVPESWSAITIRHLLSHTSGLVREGPAFRNNKIQPDADIVRSGYSQSLVFPTGSKWQYSNLGYFTIAEIIRIVSGKPWSEFIKERIFRPAEMTSTYLTSDTVPNKAVGYHFQDDKQARVNDAAYSALRPSGAFLSTIKDMGKWDALLYTDKILTTENRRQLWTPTTLSDGKTTPYGLGWFIETTRGKRRASHGGGQVGFNSHFIHGFEDGISVIILTNSDKASPERIANEAARLAGR